MERYEIGKGMKEGLGFKRVMKEGKKGSGRELKERLRMKDGGSGPSKLTSWREKNPTEIEREFPEPWHAVRVNKSHKTPKRSDL
ncbi:hypothetical protein Pmani_031991 [Petrolisthes manimaculis]|uniref:Uncharacterized protein n=1 Tax=Petrolisthes manimaculis TaxID=1843537 RepID=A0AAE1NUK7_9EUCA|nr:hypothetical protein Pmani_031991 [Petrolisthes manimaculis]